MYAWCPVGKHNCQPHTKTVEGKKPILNCFRVSKSAPCKKTRWKRGLS